MKMRKWSRAMALLGASATLGLGLSACEPRNDDINRVQPGYVTKALFESGDEWYYRRTVTESEVTNTIVTEGSGDIYLEKVSFEVQENWLIAYKPYENTPGAQEQFTVDGEFDPFFKGVVLAAWPITSHFDIQRSYDGLTGNVTNVISENTVDRPWTEREYMRVDFSMNTIEGQFFADFSFGYFPVGFVSTGQRWTSLSEDPTDYHASRFSEDYIEINDRVNLGMDIFSCAFLTGFSFPAFTRCGYGEAKLRHAFVKVDPNDDYQPREYPDSYVRKDANGNTIYDDETGEVLRENIVDRFGFFRVSTPTYDRRYQRTESGRLYRAMIFDIWERHTNDQGDVLPLAQRTPKPIIYYTNAEWPPRYRKIAEDVGEDYNRIYTEMVTDITGSAPAEKMFQVLENDCSESNIVTFVSAPEGDTDMRLFAVQRAVCQDGESCSVTLDNLADHIGIGNLRRICTSLESATMDPETGISEFQWQRIGDPRYSMLVWYARPQASGWSGYGPMHADPETGKTIAATSYLRGHYIESGVANIVDYIEFINDELTKEDIIFGQNIRKQVSDTLRAKNAIYNLRPAQSLVQNLRSRIDNYGANKAERLRENTHAKHQIHRLEAARGTTLEEPFLTEEALALASRGLWNPRMGVAAPDDIEELASPFGMVTQGYLSEQRMTVRKAMGASGHCFLEQDFDQFFDGLAFEMKDMTREQRFEAVADRMIKHVLLHEVGHNVGFNHNFEGSYDALNYPDEFWRLHFADDVTKQQQGYEAMRNTTVMEYFGAKGVGTDKLGKYDEAAIRFAYGNQVATFAGNVDPNLQGGQDLAEWRIYNDYKDIPSHLCGGNCTGDEAVAAINTREWVTFDPQNPPANEVPFMFCDNTYSRETPFCATFDYGSSMKEIHANYLTMYKNYYYFTHHQRDRTFLINWRPWASTTMTSLALDFTDVVAQYFYHLSVSDPKFRGSALESDMVAALGSGLNMAAEIMGTPDYRVMAPWPGADPAVYIDCRYLGGCDEYTDPTSPRGIAQELMQPSLGDARPPGIKFSPEFEEYNIEMMGSYFDKQEAMMRLARTRPRLLRFNYDLDRRNYYISLYRLFEPELDEFYSKLFRFDGFFLRQATATDLGSFWCRDSESPDVAALGSFEARKLMDVENGTMLPGPSDGCTQPAFIYPSFFSNTPYTAMFIAHAMLSSDFDSQADMGKLLKVYVPGTDDAPAVWDSLPNCEAAQPGENCYCAVTNNLTGFEYRAINLAGRGAESPACNLIEATVDAQASYQQSNGNPFNFDNMQQWFERLEYARDLYRVYNNRYTRN